MSAGNSSWKRRVYGTWRPCFSLNILRRKKKESPDAAGQRRQRRPRNWDPPTKLSDEPLPDGWEYHVDPYGEPYFYNTLWRLATRSDVTDPDDLEDVTYEYELLNQLHKDYLDTLDDFLIQVFIRRSSDPDEPYHVKCFILDYSRCMLSFSFLDPKERLEIHDDFWGSVFELPVHHDLPRRVEDTVLATLIYYATEQIMGDERTTFEDSLNQCLQKISACETLRMSGTSAKTLCVRGWFMAFTMADIDRSRSHYHYGEVGAVTTIQSNTIWAPSWKQRLLDICLLVLCFGTHKMYRKRLYRIPTTDGYYTKIYLKYLEGSSQEWSDIELLGTVFVLANMTFLGFSQSLPTKTQETLIFVSTAFSMASLLGSMYLMWKHRARGLDPASECIRYLSHYAGKSKLNIPSLSVLLCLPLVFLLWSIITFAAAILYVSVQSFKDVSLSHLPMVTSVIIFIIFCTFLYQLWRTSSSGASVVSRIWREIRGRRADRSDVEMDEIEGSDMEVDPIS